MFRHIVLTVVTTVCLLTRPAYAQCVDPRDAVLCAYSLTVAEESLFDASDGLMSPFWFSWAGRDYVELMPPDDCYPGVCGLTGQNDAEMLIRAAASAMGLYLYVVVHDNIWVDRADGDDWGADAVSFYLDSRSSDEIGQCLPQCGGVPQYNASLTTGSQMFAIWLGRSQLPVGFHYSHHDTADSSWQTVGLYWAEARDAYGFEAEVAILDSDHKAQEWFIPWGSAGEGLPQGAALAGRRIALDVNYCDRDGDNSVPDCLGWLGRDPWSPPGQFKEWGDLLLPASMLPVDTTALRVSGPLSGTRSRPAGQSTVTYDLRGRLIRTTALPASVVIERRLSGVGTIRRVLVGR